MALQTTDASASSLVSAYSPPLDVNHAAGAEALNVPSFTIPDADIVNMMNAPQFDFLNPPYLGSPTWNFPFFFASSPQPFSSQLSEDFDTSLALPGFVNDNSALGKDLNDVSEPHGTNFCISNVIGPAMEVSQRHGFNEPTRLHRLDNDNEDEDDFDALAAEDFGHSCRLSTENFQRVRHFLQEQSKSCQDSTKPCQGFASMTAMNAFLQLYFEHFAPQLPFIHASTFDPDNATELLLIAVANVGCQYSRSRHRHLYRSLFMQVLSDSIRQQVSLVLALVVTLLTLSQLPHNPANSNLELMQCVLLHQICLMCGGHMNEVLKLQFERNTLATLFRYSRRPMNKNSQRCPIPNMATDIKALWRTWADTETERRVLYSVWGE